MLDYTPPSAAFWSTFRLAGGQDHSRRTYRLFTAGMQMVGQGYAGPLSREDTNLYEYGRLGPFDFDCTSVAWSIRGGDAASRSALAQQATWAWNFVMTVISGSGLDTYMLPTDPYLIQQLSREEAAEMLTLLRKERAGALHGVYRYLDAPFRLPAAMTTFAIHLDTGSTPWVPPTDTFVRFTLHGLVR